MRNRSAESNEPIHFTRPRGTSGGASAALATAVRPVSPDPVSAQAVIRAQAVLDRLLLRLAIVTPAALRLSLALVFVWFGALKLAGDSPVAALISATVPWGEPNLVVRTLGVVEVVLGLGLLIGKAQRLLLLALAAHLAGTFLTFVMAPGMTMRHGNPFLLTADGEFVLKNLVLISAAVLLASQRPTRQAPAK